MGYGEAAVQVIALAAQAAGTRRAIKASKKEASKNRAFQERLSSTSYQRGVEDLKLAGLNPALAYMQGGASGASGSQAPIGNVMEGFASGVAEITRQKEQRKTGQASRDLMEAQGSNAQSQGESARMQAAASIINSQTNARKQLADEHVSRRLAEKHTHDARSSKIQADFWEKFGPNAFGAIKGAGLVGAGLGAARVLGKRLPVGAAAGALAKIGKRSGRKLKPPGAAVQKLQRHTPKGGGKSSIPKHRNDRASFQKWLDSKEF